MHDGGLDQTDGSVMFSLRELRELETERIVNEAMAERQRELARVLAEQEASARAAAIADRQHEAALEAEREADNARARAERERERELVAMEARLHDEAERRMAEARRQAEARARVALRRASPLRRIAPAALGALVAVGVTAAWVMRADERQLTRDRQEAQLRAQRSEEELARQRAEVERRLHERLGHLRQQLQRKEQETTKITGNLPPEPQTERAPTARKPAASRHRTPAKSVLEGTDPKGLGLLDNL